jgi:hypothetical protein
MSGNVRASQRGATLPVSGSMSDDLHVFLAINGGGFRMVDLDQVVGRDQAATSLLSKRHLPCEHIQRSCTSAVTST